MVNNNASRPIELLSKDFNYTIGTQDNVQKIISNQLNIGNVSSSVNLKAPDYLEESYTLQLPDRKGNDGQILTVTDNKLSWVEPVEPKIGPITNITYVHEDLKTHLKDDNDEHFPSEYAIKVNPTSPTCKLLVQFKLSYKTSIHIDNQINFIIEKSYINDDGDVIVVRVSEEKLYGTPNATGGLITEYITNIIDTSETTKEITYKLGFKVDGEIYAEPLGILGKENGYKNTIVIQELNEFHDTNFNGSLTYNDLNTTLSNSINAANNLFSERVEKLETEKLKVELITDNDIVKPYHPGNYPSVTTTKGALPVYDSNYQFSEALVSMYTNGIHDNINVDYQNSTTKNARVYNVNNIVTTTEELSIISPNNLMLSKRHSQFEFSFNFTANEANKAVTSLMLNIEPKNDSYECYYLDIFDTSGEIMLKLSSETEMPSSNHGLIVGTNYQIKLVKTAENLKVDLIDSFGNIMKSLDVTQDYSNSMHIGLLSNKNVSIDNIVLNTEENNNNNNNPSVELVTNDDIITPLHSGSFTSVTVSQGALPIRNNKLLYVDSLVSLYSNGLDESFSIDFVNTTTKQGFVANVDNIITTLEDIDMLSNKNLMTTKKHSDFVYSCTFNLLEVNKPVLSLLLDIEQDDNSYKYKYFDITNPNNGSMKTSADTPSNTSGFALDIEYELRIVKVADTARVYLKNLKNYLDLHIGNITGLNEEVYLGLAHNKHLSIQNIKIESDLHLHPTPFPTWETLKEINSIKEKNSLLEIQFSEIMAIIAGKADTSALANLATQDSLNGVIQDTKARLALDQDLPLLLTQNVQEPTRTSGSEGFWGVTVDMKGNYMAVGVPQDADGDQDGRIDIYEKGSTWILASSVKHTPTAEIGSNLSATFGRFINMSDDSAFLAQTSLFAGPINGFEWSSLFWKPPQQPAATWTLPEDRLPVDENGHLTGVNFDGTYEVTDGSSGYNYGVSISLVPQLDWIAEYFGVTVVANVTDGVVTSITIANTANVPFNYYDASDKAALQSGNIVTILPPVSEYTPIATFPKTKRCMVSGDGTRIGVIEASTDRLNFEFKIYSVETTGVTLLQTELLGSEEDSSWCPMACTTNGLTFVVCLGHGKQFVFTAQSDTPTTYTKVEYNNSYSNLMNAELSNDGEYLFFGDRTGEIVDFFKLVDGSYIKQSTISDSLKNFGGGHISLQLTPDKTKLVVCARNFGDADLPASGYSGGCYVYTQDASNRWNRVATVPPQAFNSVHGSSASVTNTHLVVTTVSLDTSITNYADIYFMSDHTHDVTGARSRAQAIANLQASVAALQEHIETS